MMTFCAVVFSLALTSIAQDTLTLEQVDVYAPKIERFAQGQKVTEISSRVLGDYRARSLGDLLQENSPLFIRQYGAGMLASPSFRGTSAGHTAIFWNGLPVNSPSLGQSDLSILPTQAFDQVQLQYGSSGALLGNEAIGGSVHLGTRLSFDAGFRGELNQQIGSFGLMNTAVSIGFSTKKFSTRSKFYRFRMANDFPFKDLGQPETPKINQDHASINQLGFLQDFAWNIRPNQQLKFAYWWSQADREIQPVMGSVGRDVQFDENHRLAFDYFLFGEGSTLNLKAGLVLESQLFNESQNDTDQYFLSADWDKAYNSKWSLKVGARYSRAEGELSVYEALDQRIEGYQSLKYAPSEQLSTSISLRELVYSEGKIPFVPSVGLDWNVFNSQDISAMLKISGGRGFKIPTLNDRFWEPGGNPELLPEESLNGEVGIHFTGQKNNSWKSSLTYYRMSVNNWIIWLPQGSVWSPENIRNVQNQGLELDFEWNGNQGAFQWTIQGNYAYSNATSTKEGEGDFLEPGSQLPYTPEHQANIRFLIAKEGLSLSLSSFFVGSRKVTSDALREMPSYQLVNMSMSYSKLKVGNATIPLSFQINNIFNTDYQVLYLRAMPGRSFQLNLTINL